MKLKHRTFRNAVGHNAIGNWQNFINRRTAYIAAGLSTFVVVGGEAVAAINTSPADSILTSQSPQQHSRVSYAENGKRCKGDCHKFGFDQVVSVQHSNIQQTSSGNTAHIEILDQISNSGLPIDIDSFEVGPDSNESIDYVGTTGTEYQVFNTKIIRIKHPKHYSYSHSLFGKSRTYRQPFEPFSVYGQANVYVDVSVKLDQPYATSAQEQNTTLTFVINSHPMPPIYTGSISNDLRDKLHIQIEPYQ